MEDDSVSYDLNIPTSYDATGATAISSDGLPYTPDFAAPAGVFSSAPSSSDTGTSFWTSLANGLSSVTNSAANIVRATNTNQAAGYYDAAGVWHPISGGSAVTTPGGISTLLTQTASGLTGVIGSFLPIIIIGVALFFVVKIFGKK